MLKLLDFMPVLVTCKFEDPKMKTLLCPQHFLDYKPMGVFGYHGKKGFSSDMPPKTLCIFSSTPMMFHTKFDQEWSTDLKDLQV